LPGRAQLSIIRREPPTLENNHARSAQQKGRKFMTASSKIALVTGGGSGVGRARTVASVKAG